MPKKTCPLCGGKLKNNYCESCGYDVPEDDDLSALYDMEPENDAFGEVVREVTPDVQSEEIYPNRPAGYDTAYEQPKFKVRDNNGNTVHQNQYGQQLPPSPFTQQNGQNGQNQQSQQSQQNQQNASPYRWYGGCGGAQNNGGNAAPPPSPFANQGGQGGQGSQGSKRGQTTQYASAGDFMKSYWWLLLLSFFIPIAGILILVYREKYIDKKYIGIVIAAIVLGFIFPP